jgi:hypothetical protein
MVCRTLSDCMTELVVKWSKIFDVGARLAWGLHGRTIQNEGVALVHGQGSLAHDCNKGSPSIVHGQLYNGRLPTNEMRGSPCMVQATKGSPDCLAPHEARSLKNVNEMRRARYAGFSAPAPVGAKRVLTPRLQSANLNRGRC